MGTESNTQSSIPETQEIIDFLYVDKERADSFISQIRNGTLRSVTQTVGTSESSSISGKGSAGIVGGSVQHGQTSNDSAAKQYDPYHSQLLDLLNDLDIHPLSSLPEADVGQLVLLNCPIAIRDAATMRILLSITLKNKWMMPPLKDKATRNVMNMVSDLLQQMPDSISLSLNFHGLSITGTLKESGLSISQSDLMRTYGAQLPGEWLVLGILDTALPVEPPTDSVQSIEDAIDLCSSATNKLFSSSLLKIIPILIFRPVHY